ncbi:hypothetical protein SAMN05444287_2153 [Octadecabacter temperatus]|uniref:Uncharacterized protein n=1 Tax=Octadecabacter temperatus TaxID=1458307 RepID=A0A0K0Y7T6_9RHOB|nr:hypothetical protein [Octadecabacter temperatus]AKS47028.1 hypothetical protein OSB_24930 [Octadecabacter temperatus]SIO25459.1 hypothetical protein SAMN05444287_2153 [Octadecabacter temperatus]
MKHLVLTAALTASPVFADTVDVYVVDPDGEGVLQHESDVTIQEADLLIEGERPPGARGVVLERGKPVSWTDLPPEGVNERYGGDGPPPIVNLDDSEMDFDEDDLETTPSNGELQGEEPSVIDVGEEDTQDLTPEPDSMQSARIQPRDGFWIIEIQDQVFSGCSAAIESAAQTQMAALQTSGNRSIFGPNFTPEQMAPQLDWTQIGTNSWFGSHDMTQDGTGVFLQWGVQVISPTLINHRQHLTFAMGPLGNCDAYTFTQAAWMN